MAREDESKSGATLSTNERPRWATRIAILEDAGYIRDVSTRRETPIFRMTQDFVREVQKS